MRATACLLVLVVALVVIAAGCGGGSHRLSHEEYIRRANTICIDWFAQTVSFSSVSSPGMIGFYLGSPRGIANLVSWSEGTLSIARQDFGEFERLKPPKADEAGWKAFAAEGDKAIVWVGKVEAAAKRNDQTAILRLVADSQKEWAREARIARRAGLAECLV